MNWGTAHAWWTLLYAWGETGGMVLVASVCASSAGFFLGVFCFMAQHPAFYPCRWLHTCLSSLINLSRSIPFIILAIALIPFTRWLTGSSIGTLAMCVPLSIAGIPYFARLTELALHENRVELIEAGTSLGATPYQLLRYIVLPESTPALVRAMTLLMVGLTEYTAMAGAIGGGGLGQLAIEYGYYRFDTLTLCITIVIIMVWVQGIQRAGDCIARYLSVS